MKSLSAYEIATEKIICLLEQGVAPWRQSWVNEYCIPAMNYANLRPYRGFNQLLLSLVYSDPYFLTYKQIQAQGGRVKAGAKSAMVFYWNWIFFDAQGNKVQDESLATTCIPYCRYTHVFNACDIKGIKFEYPVNKAFPNHQPIDKCEKIVKHTGANIVCGGNSAYYKPNSDTIYIPPLKQFNTPEDYYAILFHELGHWTGHHSRLNRYKVDHTIPVFGSPDYSREELIAELCAAFVCTHCQIETPSLDANAAAYLQSWINALNGNPTLILTAAAQAQKAADYLLKI